MDNRKLISGLAYRGNGFFTYTDSSEDRMSELDVARKVGKSLGKRVKHICSTPYPGHIMHVLQYEHLFIKDEEREARRSHNN